MQVHVTLVEQINQFENVPLDVWHNPQEFPYVNHILGLQNLSADVFQNFFQIFF
jgi:hypothetical protein